MIRVCQGLPPEEEHLVLDERASYGDDLGIGEVGEVNVGDDGTEGRAERFDGKSWDGGSWVVVVVVMGSSSGSWRCGSRYGRRRSGCDRSQVGADLGSEGGELAQPPDLGRVGTFARQRDLHVK